MIRVQGLEYRYPGAADPAVRDIGFEVERGEIFGFLGPSGAGKTTTQKVLIGLLDGYAGRVEVLGREVSGWGSDLYERIGVSFELPNHFSKLTARENLTLFGGLYASARSDPAPVLGAVGLEDAAETRVGEFSKGMKNRLSVARALLHGPELLFLDEPTAGLDPVNARRIRDLVSRQRDAGRTVVLTTHDMVTADVLCDRVGFIVDGRVTLIGAPRELKLEHGRRVVRVEAGEGATRQVHEFDLDHLAGDARFAALLQDSRIDTIHSLEATLEQVFVDVTGRSLS